MNTIIYDLETTGLNPFGDQIIEYSFLNITTNQSISNLVNPNTQIEKKITEITGITNQQLSDKLSIANHIKTIFNFINKEDTYLIAHNNDNFDRYFITELFKKFFKTGVLKCKFIDTIPLAKKLFTKSNSYIKIYNYKLKTLCKMFNIEEGNHRAENDTIALYHVYINLIKIYCNIHNQEHEYEHEYEHEHEHEYDHDYIIANPNIIYNYIY